MKTNAQLSPESEHTSFLHTSVLFFYGQLQERKTLTLPLAQEYLLCVCGGGGLQAKITAQQYTGREDPAKSARQNIDKKSTDLNRSWTERGHSRPC